MSWLKSLWLWTWSPFWRLTPRSIMRRRFGARPCRHLCSARRALFWNKAGGKMRKELPVAPLHTPTINIWSVPVWWQDGESLCGAMWTSPVYCQWWPISTAAHICLPVAGCVSDDELVYQADAGSRSPTLNCLSQNFPIGKPIMSARINHGKIPQGSPSLEQDVTEVLILPARILAVSL